MTLPAPDADPSICIGCGLCCDGTLHATAKVQPGDEAVVTAARLAIEEEGERRFFRQPCPNFSCGSCTVYGHRPPVCRTYQCALLLNVEAGEVSKPDARETIASAKKLVAAVRAIDPTAVTPAQRSALADRLKTRLQAAAGADRDATAKALLDIAVLEHFLARWFLKDKNKPGPQQGDPR